MKGGGHSSTRADVLLMAGDDLVEATIPGPVRLLDPPPPLEPVTDFRGAVRVALASPRGCRPLARLAGPGARVTVAFDDPCLPLPPMIGDPRRIVLEEVVGLLLDAGVAVRDLDLVCANGLHRKWSSWELLPLVGPRLLAAVGSRLSCYDAEDADANTSLGTTPSGLRVEMSRSVAEADLVVYVGLPWTEMNGGHKSLACGLSTYRSIRQHHCPGVQAHSPLMHPPESEMHSCLTEIGRHLGERVPVFQVETVVNNRLWAGPLRLLDLRRGRLHPLLRPAKRLPPFVRSGSRRLLRSWYQPAGVWAGDVEKVHEAALARLASARGGSAEQADILILGLPNMSPYSVHSSMNPLLAANLGLGYAFQFGRQAPLVREGGHLILAAPFSAGFHESHHPAYRRFWEEVLPATRDPIEMERHFEPRYVSDRGLLAAYRFGRAYHPAHPFFAYYWMSRALAHLGAVHVGGAEDAAVVERLGFSAAASVEQAVYRAREALGPGATVLVQTVPPVFTVDVAAPRGFQSASGWGNVEGPFSSQ
jgi:lactate racemase